MRTKNFETEHNQGKIPDRAWSKLHTISDELCRKHGLSIIENPHLSKCKSHWEWELDQQNLSWKEQLKRTIDEVIKVSEDFEDFLAKFTVMSTPQMTMSRRIRELEEQIPAIEKYHEFVEYHKKYTSLEGKSKKKYGENCRYELDQYHECRKKLKELFPNGVIPKIKDLQDELKKAHEEYAKMSAERTAYKKEADRLSRLAQQKRDSQRTLSRYMENEQAAKRKKGQLE